MKIAMTKHAKNDRIDRMVYIAQTIGFGEKVVCEGVWDERGSRSCLTENGIMLIKKPDVEVLITAYIPTLEQAGMVYKSVGLKMPMWMESKVKKNRKYAKGCPA